MKFFTFTVFLFLSPVAIYGTHLSNEGHNCDKFCPRDHNPVCAEDKDGNHKIFPNVCVFEIAQCKYPGKEYRTVDMSMCNITSATCQKSCPYDYRPVCAEDKYGHHKLFANKCVFEVVQCEEPGKEYQLVELSKCGVMPNCNVKPCPKDYLPVCAEDKDGNFKTFPNMCWFENVQCEQPQKEYKLVPSNKCGINCSKPCPFILRPVCAQDKDDNRQEFDNMCLFEIAQCEYPEKELKLVDISMCSCFKSCTQEYRPVCAEDKDGNHIRFSNKCVFENARCEQPEKEYKLVDMSMCTCNKICPLIYFPVCAEDKDGNYQQFSNKCGFENEQCKHPEKEYKLVDLRMCSMPNCTKPCTKEFNPVCGEDKDGNFMTFHNKCVFENAECEQPGREYQLVDLSKCGITPNCVRSCTLDYNPVCAEDIDGNHKQFPNKCTFEFVQCEHPEKEYKLVDLNMCSMPNCTKPCSKEFNPVCGEDKDGNLMTFPNKCVFENAQCEQPGREYKLVELSKCGITPNCVKPCTFDYNTVCAEDKDGNHKQFPNKCTFEVVQCEHPEKEYKLVDMNMCSCNKICPYIYLPVCAEDNDGNHKQFPNKCTFEVVQCEHPEKEYKLVEMSMCSCNKICPYIYLPVCAEDKDGNYQQFSNKCDFENELCKRPEKEYKLVDLNMCSMPNCTKPCTKEFNPVCGEDKDGNLMTFPNKCVFENAQCEQPGRGCKLVDPSKCGITSNCIKPCTFDYNPVCAEDKDGNHQEFPNKCSFELTRCEHPGKEFELVDMRMCSCPKPCTTEYRPVCAEDKDGNHKQFPNKCTFEVFQCEHPEKEYKLVEMSMCSCNKICPYIYLPVCAEDKDGNYQQFSNKCDFENEQCKRPEKEYKLVDLNMCSMPNCTKPCTKEFNPVCGEDKDGNLMTFPNKCVFENAQCEQPGRGCKLADPSKCGITPNCVKPCTFDYNPVCAEDKNGNHQEFPNKCSFELIQCEHPDREFKLVDMRMCSCPKPCTKEYHPVCAEDKDDNHQEFSNLCTFGIEQCEHPEREYRLVDLSMCSMPNGTTPCTKEYNPVCAEDKDGNLITFPNKCVFKNAQRKQPQKEYKLVDLGMCGITLNCLKPCPLIYRPVCAEDKDGNHQEFPNMCNLEVAQCVNPEKEYELIDMKRCSCPKPCTKEYRPVCAEDKNGNHEEFSNLCHFQITQCVHPEKEFKLVDLNMCSMPNCTKPCTKELNPVCAEDKHGNLITFPNKCVFENAQCEQSEKEYKLVDLSKCGITPKCVKPCTYDYNPVCAEDKDGNTKQFPNKCVFEIKQCQHPKKEYKLVDLSKCRKVCTLEFNPVCAEDKDGNHQQFSNMCFFEIAKSEQPEKEYKLVDLSMCGTTPPCNERCTLEYRPVCAEDKDGNHITYSNKCLFDNAKCQNPEKEYVLVPLSKCNITVQCEKSCTLENNPVCAEDKDGNYLEFPNKCVFEIEDCKHPEKEYKLVPRNKCYEYSQRTETTN